MCLPFDWCQKTDHGSGAHHDTRPWPPATTDHGYNPAYDPPVVVAWSPHGYGAGGKNGAHGRAAAAGANVNRADERHGAAFVYDSDSDDAPAASVGFGRNGGATAEKTAAAHVAFPAAAPQQTPEQQRVPKTTVVPTPAWGSAPPAPQSHVAAAGARHHHHHEVVAASQPKQGAAATTTQTAPVRQMARRDEDDDYYSVNAASIYSRWR